MSATERVSVSRRIAAPAADIFRLIADPAMTSYCDWSGLPDQIREAVTFPVVPVTMLTKSLENLDAIVSRPV